MGLDDANAMVIGKKQLAAAQTLPSTAQQPNSSQSALGAFFHKLLHPNGLSAETRVRFITNLVRFFPKAQTDQKACEAALSEFSRLLKKNNVADPCINYGKLAALSDTIADYVAFSRFYKDADHNSHLPFIDSVCTKLKDKNYADATLHFASTLSGPDNEKYATMFVFAFAISSDPFQEGRQDYQAAIFRFMDRLPHKYSSKRGFLDELESINTLDIPLLPHTVRAVNEKNEAAAVRNIEQFLNNLSNRFYLPERVEKKDESA